MAKRVALGTITLLLLVLLLGCAAIEAERSKTLEYLRLYPQIAQFRENSVYTVGEILVIIRPQPEVDYYCRLIIKKAMPKGRKILGCYNSFIKTILSIADSEIIAHELRHHFEGAFHDEP